MQVNLVLKKKLQIIWRYFMNSMELKDRIRNISKERNVDFNTLLRLYMYDRFIERLSVSKYKNNFVFNVLPMSSR